MAPVCRQNVGRNRRGWEGVVEGGRREDFSGHYGKIDQEEEEKRGEMPGEKKGKIQGKEVRDSLVEVCNAVRER